MDRQLIDSEKIFSRRMSDNWAELPRTIRRHQKHRPEILNEFTDFHDNSDSDQRHYMMGKSSASMNMKRIVKRSELLRKFEMNESVWEKSMDMNEKFYDTKFINHRNSNFPSMTMKSEYNRVSPSDEERKTNSPDSLLVKSSDSELSSDDYDHTDDSGAFLENQVPNKYDAFQLGKRKLSNHDKQSRPGTSLNIQTPYENIPRISVSKAHLSTKHQPTIEEIGIQVGNGRHSSISSNGISSLNFSSSPPQNSQPTMEELRLESLIQDYYNENHQIQRATNRLINVRDKSSTMDTIKEEKPDGCKLSVREISKRFEELRMQNDMQSSIEEKRKDKILTTIQKTLQQLDERVKRSDNNISTSLVYKRNLSI